MPDDTEQLLVRLEDLHQRLSSAQTVSPELRGRLMQLAADLERLLGETPAPAAGESTSPPLGQRLSEAAERFETDHPTLATTLGSVADALSRMGI